MWKITYNTSTGLCTSCNSRDPQDGESLIYLDPKQCGWVNVYPERYKVVNGALEEIPWAKEAYELREAKKSFQNKVNTTCEAHILAKYSVYDQLNTLAGHYGEEAKGAYSLFTLNCRAESNRVWDMIEAATTVKEAEDAFATLNLPTE